MASVDACICLVGHLLALMAVEWTPLLDGRMLLDAARAREPCCGW